MKISLPRTELDEVFKHLKAHYGISFDIQGQETRLNWTKNLACGFINWSQLRAGLQIQLDCFQPQTNLAIAAQTLASY